MDLQKIKLLSCAFVGLTFLNMSTAHASEQYPSRTAGFESTRGHSPYDTSYQYENGNLVSSNKYPSRTAGFENILLVQQDLNQHVDIVRMIQATNMKMVI
ncbi:hypothetical protein [Staphylococcus aureus]|uniref:hypothetical protein n=1 Tax=Staphylococcus aureus TaxID=1280 RepID=UPI000E3BFE47|nr:hypothetical protein [Staphylococcus aureus]GBW88387.1 hypothetical protein M1K219_0882 [Staphylococcus aureus]